MIVDLIWTAVMTTVAVYFVWKFAHKKRKKEKITVEDIMFLVMLPLGAVFNWIRLLD